MTDSTTETPTDLPDTATTAPAAAATDAAFDPARRATELAILDALRAVVDPEIGMNVVELALIKQILLRPGFDRDQDDPDHPLLPVRGLDDRAGQGTDRDRRRSSSPWGCQDHLVGSIVSRMLMTQLDDVIPRSRGQRRRAAHRGSRLGAGGVEGGVTAVVAVSGRSVGLRSCCRHGCSPGVSVGPHRATPRPAEVLAEGPSDQAAGLTPPPARGTRYWAGRPLPPRCSRDRRATVGPEELGIALGVVGRVDVGGGDAEDAQLGMVGQDHGQVVAVGPKLERAGARSAASRSRTARRS